MTRQYDAVFLDAQGTLLEPHPSTAAIYAEACQLSGLSATDGQVALAISELWDDLRKTAGADSNHDTSEEATREWWSAFNTRLFHRLGGRGSLETFLQHLWQSFGQPERWRLFPDTEEVLVALKRRGYRMGIVSNWDSRLLEICDRLGITPLMDFIIASAPAGVEKPDRRIFQMALSSAGVGPDRALHVGDDYEADILGARGAGIDALWLKRGSDDPTPDGAISSLRELLQILP